MSTKKSDYFIISGDFVPSGDYKRGKLLCPKLKELFIKSKFNIVNLESPVTKFDLPSLKAGPNLKLDDSIGWIFEDYKINAVTLANNHICDYGITGIKDTFSFLKKHNVSYGGVISDGKDFQLSQYIGEDKVSFFNYCESEFCKVDDRNGAIEIDPCLNYLDIVNCKSDFKVVILHAGTEHSYMPNKWLRKVCRYYIDIGADLVLCHHTHVVSGFEVYKNKEIFYGLGNFIFPSSKPKKSWAQGFSLKVYIENKKLKTSLLPHEQSKDFSSVSLLDGINNDLFIQEIKGISKLIENNETYNEYWDKYYESEKVNYLSAALNQSRFERGIFRKFNVRFKKYNEEKQLLRTLNFIKCQSHRSVFIEVLKRFSLNNNHYR